MSNMSAAIEKYKDRWNANPGSYLPFIAKKFARLWYATNSGSNTAIVISINLPFYLLGIVDFLPSFESATHSAIC